MITPAMYGRVFIARTPGVLGFSSLLGISGLAAVSVVATDLGCLSVSDLGWDSTIGVGSTSPVFFTAGFFLVVFTAATFGVVGGFFFAFGIPDAPRLALVLDL